MAKIKCDNSLELSKFTETSTLPDFTFIIDGRTYKCKTVQICSLSPVIFHQLQDFQSSKDNDKYYDRYFSYSFDEINNNQNNNITCDKLKDPHLYFQLFLDAIEGKNITITKFNAFFFNYIANLLQIEEFVKATLPFMSFKLNTANAIQILFYFSECNIRNKDAIDYVSSNWSQFDFPIETIKNYASKSSNKSDSLKLEKMIHFPFEFFDFVFSNRNFKPRSDEWLFQFIHLLVKRNKAIKEYRYLFQYVRFEKLTNVDINKIIKCVSFDSIPSNFVENFEQRFISEIDGKVLVDDEEYDSDEFLYDYQEEDAEDDEENVDNNNNNEEEDNNVYDDDDDDYDYNNNENQNLNQNETININEKKIKFTYKFGYHFKGVFDFFTQNKALDSNIRYYCGGTKQNKLYHIFEYDENEIYEHYWDSFNGRTPNDIKSAWVVISFVNHQFKLKNYTIATSPESLEKIQNGVQPKSWIIEASNSVIKDISDIDDAKWSIIAKEENSKAFIVNTKLDKTFGIEKRNHEFYRSFRFKMMKNNAQPSTQWCNLLKLNALEFYGTLVRISKKK